MAFNLLHLVDDLSGALRQLHARLEPGGVFISKTVCMGEKPGIYPVALFVMRKLGKAPMVYFLKIAELEQAIAGAGFEIVETGDYPAKPPSHFVVARKR